MQGLIGGVAATQLGPAISETANDLSQSSDRIALQQLQNQGHLDYANVLFNSKQSIAEMQADSRERVAAMSQENQGLKTQLAQNQQQSLDPNTDQGLTNMAQRVAARASAGGKQYDPQEVLGLLSNYRKGTLGDAQIPPEIANAYNQELQAATYGGNLQHIGAGLVDINKAAAGGTMSAAAGGSSDPTTVDTAVRAATGQPLAEGSASGVVDPTDPNADTNAAVNRNASEKANAAASRAAGAAKDTDFIHANAVLQASEKQLAELDRQATQIQNGAVTPQQQRAAQAQLAQIADQRRQVQAQYDQARTVIMPGATAGTNPAGAFWTH